MSCENGGYLTHQCKSCRHWVDDSWDYGCGNVYFDKCPHLQKPKLKDQKHNNIYAYCGPVFIFEHCIDSCWRGRTKAVSENKARSNLAYQWKRIFGYAMNAKVSLPGQITRIG